MLAAARAGVPRSRHRLAGHAARRACRRPDPRAGGADVVLLVDGFGALRTDFEELEDSLIDLLQRGGSFGIHVVLAMTRWNELRMAHQPLIGTRLRAQAERPGRLGDRPQAGRDPPRRRSRAGCSPTTACSRRSRCRCSTTPTTPGSARRSRRWRSGPRPAGTARPPRRSGCCRGLLARRSCPTRSTSRTCSRSGCARTPWSRPCLDLGSRDQHLLVFGDTRSGKTTLLRGIVRGLVDRLTPGRAGARGHGRPRRPGRRGARSRTSAATPRRRSRPAACRRAIAAELEKRSTVRRRRWPVRGSWWSPTTTTSSPPAAPNRCGRCCPTCRPPATCGCTSCSPGRWPGPSRAMYDVALQAIRDTGGTLVDLVRRAQRGPDPAAGVCRADGARPRPLRPSRRAAADRAGRQLRRKDRPCRVSCIW